MYNLKDKEVDLIRSAMSFLMNNAEARNQFIDYSKSHKWFDTIDNTTIENMENISEGLCHPDYED